MASTKRGAALGLLGLASCSFAPPYKPPALTIPSAYTDTGPWAPASPADTAPRGDWWTMFNDPTLDALEVQLNTANPDLAAALARFDQARQYAAEAEAAQYPILDLDGSVTQYRQSNDRPLREHMGPDQYASDELYGAASWELDLWGKIRNQVAAGEAQAQATEADTADTRLSLQSQLADAYFSLRGADAQVLLLRQTSAAYGRALGITEDQHTGGIVSGLDVGRAQTQYDSAAAALTDETAQRALFLHELASLAGVPAPAFTLRPEAALATPPVIPVAAPSALLQRRPDIAAAERRVAAANAQIGVARAAFFPTISLSAQGGFEAAGGGISLFDLPNNFWSVGPSLALTLFDGGYRHAVTRTAHDQFDEAGADYRATVLTAFQQVEDNLVLANQLALEARQQADAVHAASQTESLSMTLYQGGADTYLDVVTAQAALLDAQRAQLSIATRRLQASVNLVRASGGGWTSSQLQLTADLP